MTETAPFTVGTRVAVPSNARGWKLGVIDQVITRDTVSVRCYSASKDRWRPRAQVYSVGLLRPATALPTDLQSVPIPPDLALRIRKSQSPFDRTQET